MGTLVGGESENKYFDYAIKVWSMDLQNFSLKFCKFIDEKWGGVKEARKYENPKRLCYRDVQKVRFMLCKGEKYRYISAQVGCCYRSVTLINAQLNRERLSAGLPIINKRDRRGRHKKVLVG